jgi:hypothetical protein
LEGGSARRKASTYAGQHKTEKWGRTSIPRAGFELAIAVFERLKTVRDLDSAATGAGSLRVIFAIVLLSSSSSSLPSPQVSFPLVLLLNQWVMPPLRLQVSDCVTFLIMCDVPSITAFCILVNFWVLHWLHRFQFT